MIAVAAVRWGWLLAAVGLAGFLVVRRGALSRRLLAAGAAGALACALLGTGVVELPNLEKLIEDAGQALGGWTYLLVGALAFLETGAFIGLVAPGETAVIVGGVVAGQGQISLLVLIAVTWSCAVAGDLTSYTIGRRLGRAWLVRHGERVKITEDRLRRVDGFFERRGGLTILIGRFIGFVRPISPFLAGASKMPLRTFLPYDVVGAGAWAATFCVLGFVFWHSFDQLTTYVSRGLLAFGSVVALGAGLIALVQVRRDPAKRERVRVWLERQEHKPAMRPLVRLAGPAWRLIGRPAATGVDAVARFGLNRVRPGELGLELTTLLALFLVGSFSFFVIGDALGDGGPTGIDRVAADVAEALTLGALIDVAKVVSALGSLPFTGAVVALTAVWALRRGRSLEAATLVGGMLVSYVGVHVGKAAYDRPRPPGGLIGAHLSSFPSGHALYAVALVACATVLVRAGSGWALRFAAVTPAVAVVAAVGLCRVYLRVHYLTDVLGGVALGTAIWAGCGIVALVARYVRHNAGRRR